MILSVVVSPKTEIKTFHFFNFSFLSEIIITYTCVQCYKNAVSIVMWKRREVPFLKGVKNGIEMFTRELSFMP